MPIVCLISFVKDTNEEIPVFAYYGLRAFCFGLQQLQSPRLQYQFRWRPGVLRARLITVADTAIPATDIITTTDVFTIALRIIRVTTMADTTATIVDAIIGKTMIDW